jgi:hypothetical protein
LVVQCSDHSRGCSAKCITRIVCFDIPVVLRGVMWCYVVLCGVVWCYVALCGVIWHCAMLCGMVWCYVSLCDVAQLERILCHAFSLCSVMLFQPVQLPHALSPHSVLREGRTHLHPLLDLVPNTRYVVMWCYEALCGAMRCYVVLCGVTWRYVMLCGVTYASASFAR